MKKVLRSSLAALLLFSMLGIILFFFIPTILDTWVIPILLKRMSLGNQHVQIARLTPFGASGTMRFAAEDIPALAIPQFEILFSPTSLLNRRLTALILDHATLHLTRQDGRISLQGLISPADKDRSTAGTPVPPLPFMVETLLLKECSVILHEPQKPDVRLSISARITPTFSNHAGSSFALESINGSFILSDALSARGTVSSSRDNTNEIIALHFDSNFFTLPDRFRRPETALAESGPIAVDLLVSLEQQTLSMTSFDVRGTIKGLRLKSGPVEIQGGGAEQDLAFSLSGTPAKFDYHLSPVEVSRPVQLTASVSGSLMAEPKALSARGQIQAALRTAPPDDASPIPFSIDYSGDYLAGERWKVNMEGQSLLDRPATLLLNRLLLTIAGFSFSGKLQGGDDGLQADMHVNLTPFDLFYKQTQITSSGLKLLLQAKKNHESIAAVLEAAIPRLSLQTGDFVAEDLHFKLPISFPFSLDQPKDPGTFSVASLVFRQDKIASLLGSLQQRENRIEIALRAQAAFAPDLILAATGSWTPADKQFGFNWDLPPTLLESAKIPESLVFPAGYEFGARVETSGELNYRDNRLSGAMRTSLQDGYLTSSENSLSVQDINCTLENPRLPEFRSAPSQKCTAKTIDLGTFNFSDATLTYRLEDSQTLFVEKSGVRWAKGYLESGSMRLSPADSEVDTTIYCSRITFAELLNQFGFDQTEGEGALNGRLPVKITKTGVRFDDGFLFSTPGTGGIVRFNNTDLLRQGMGGITQAGYLSYSLKALEDFAYNWTRLSFNSTGDELLMSMELDGKPRSPLPFSFKDGMITETDQGNGLQYPVRLDVNFRLPLDELLQVGRSIKSTMGNR